MPKAELVFDVVGSARFLAQVWLPGKDGCLVGRQNEAQEQVTVKSPRPTSKFRAGVDKTPQLRATVHRSGGSLAWTPCDPVRLKAGSRL